MVLTSACPTIPVKYEYHIHFRWDAWWRNTGTCDRLTVSSCLPLSQQKLTENIAKQRQVINISQRQASKNYTIAHMDSGSARSLRANYRISPRFWRLPKQLYLDWCFYRKSGCISKALQDSVLPVPLYRSKKCANCCSCVFLITWLDSFFEIKDSFKRLFPLVSIAQMRPLFIVKLKP
jgi:hypothetical protein